MNRGFVVLAQNTEKVDYIKCATALALSIKRTMPNESVTLVTNNIVPSKYEKYFDNITPLPYGDLSPYSDWKLINDWQVYEASPYEHTIKIEADIFIPQPIDYWWNILPCRDVVISTGVRNFKQDISSSRFYRKFIDDNNLPDCYNALTYFKKSDTAAKFFTIVKDIFNNWNEYRATLRCKIDEPVTTDWAYALASHIIGVEKTTLPNFNNMTMVHMKQFINDIPCENWTDILIYELLSHTVRINTYPQLYPFHYVVKEFADKILASYDGK